MSWVVLLRIAQVVLPSWLVTSYYTIQTIPHPIKQWYSSLFHGVHFFFFFLYLISPAEMGIARMFFSVSAFMTSLQGAIWFPTFLQLSSVLLFLPHIYIFFSTHICYRNSSVTYLIITSLHRAWYIADTIYSSESNVLFWFTSFFCSVANPIIALHALKVPVNVTAGSPSTKKERYDFFRDTCSCWSKPENPCFNGMHCWGTLWYLIKTVPLILTCWTITHACVCTCTLRSLSCSWEGYVHFCQAPCLP